MRLGSGGVGGRQAEFWEGAEGGSSTDLTWDPKECTSPTGREELRQRVGGQGSGPCVSRDLGDR